ncbi:hypothetical protein [Clostridium sp. 1001275B_160808_H3]|uniref:hypothetical protein n=1 Tax=Clostridium sp. 1001275B_160808_H3 TaxID=2787110 RepID=UPI00189A7486|nr:hypothetical protein [Clostridium sp. 1001275B_160808_H3]
MSIKRVGIGTISLILSIFGIAFSFTYLGSNSIGEEILHAIGVSFPTMIVSIILFLISIVIGRKFKNNFGSNLGVGLAICFTVLIVTLSINSAFFSIF